eukprot:CAMPEP_0115508084 /NCGR_PEP_ID=MMETSP0271-20121206/72106_1 /TAXON_ID=71861 /ORGANISM="Scrippsiella trochoidea, Strain CCMP3099" /LENGTH=537 /DNA_ID=CAMNT_0002937789 /DNA_START=64 /DNA_END=1677 /DNA_ORIENTATION=-
MALRSRLTAEESRAERLDHELEEAAAFGRQLLSANEELQQEIEFLRREQHDQEEQPSPGVEPLPVGFRPRLKRMSTESTKLSCDRREPGETSNERRKSVDLLANEFESDLQDLLAQNLALSGKAQQLERDNRALQEKILQDNTRESSRALDPEELHLSSRADRLGRLQPEAKLVDVSDFESREDALMSELDDEKARAWELEQQLLAANQEASKLHSQVSILFGECQDQQGACEAKEAEVESLRRRIQELTDAVQAQRVAESTEKLLPPTPEGRRFECFFTSLERDMQTAYQGGGATDDTESGPRSPSKSKADLELFRQVEELREQLVTAEDAGRESRRLRSELALQRREADRLREELRASEEHVGRREFGSTGTIADCAAAKPEERSSSPSSPLSSSSSSLASTPTATATARAMAAEEEAEALRAEAAELRRRLAVSEASGAEAREAAQRQRELARRARQASQREAEELRERLLSAEDRACQAADPGSRQSQRELLSKVDQLQRALQAETKARRFIEAELLRTLAGIRNMDTELHAC